MRPFLLETPYIYYLMKTLLIKVVVTGINFMSLQVHQDSFTSYAVKQLPNQNRLQFDGYL